jgi:hypothetical protein
MAFSIYQGAKTKEDRIEIKHFGLAYTVVMKLLKMEITCQKVTTYLTALQLYFCA